MNQFGIVLSNKSSKEEFKVFIYFKPMDYFDWSLFIDSPEMYEKSSIRYLADKYIVSATKTEGDVTTSLTSVDISSLPIPICKEFVDKLVEKSGFANTEYFDSLLERSKTISSTIVGAYDLFIYLHAGIDVYLKMLKCTVAERAQFVAVLERLTGITVKERFNIAVEAQADLDLTSPAGKYRPMKNGRAATGLRQNREPQHDFQPSSEKPDASSLDSLLNHSRNELSRALQEGMMNGRRKDFDWMHDNKELSRLDNDPGMEVEPT